eukprot:1947275-Pleurochrysis_carterae.AAC.1
MPMLLLRAANMQNATAVTGLEAELQCAMEGRIWARVREEEVKRVRAEEASRVLQEQVDAQQQQLSARSQKVTRRWPRSGRSWPTCAF